MKVIRFEARGVLNSFRIPFFKTYHKSFLTPPKTTIIGLICNISLKSQKEFFEILNKDLIKTAVVLGELGGKSKDLWTYKLYEKKNYGKSVIRRDKLYLTKYFIYLQIDDENLSQEIYQGLKNPKNIPALGLDDELVFINNVKIIELKDNLSKNIHSSFLTNQPKISNIIQINENSHIEMPTFYNIPTKFEAYDKKGNRKSKEVKEQSLQVEFFNCSLEVKNIQSYFDKELQFGVILN